MCQPVNKNETYHQASLFSKEEFKREISGILFKEKKVEHDNLRGIYITSSTAASDHFTELMDTLTSSGGNAVVMDIESGGGRLAFLTKDPHLKSLNPGSDQLTDLKSLIRELHHRDIYVIARQVVFNDPYTADKKPEWRIKYKNGSLFDHRWLDPSHPEVQAYNLRITRELVALGFDEIQYDYIRFPDEYHDNLDYYYDESSKKRWEVIVDFLKDAKKITEGAGIKLGIDVFGATIYGNIDWDLVGQHIPEIAKTVDVIYPMTYPSHISPGYSGFQNPYGDPRPFIRDAIGRFETASDGHAEIRTWIQGFPLKIPDFGPWFIKAQVQGTYDAGANDFVIWSPGNIYANSWSSLSLLPPESSPLALTEQETTTTTK